MTDATRTTRRTLLAPAIVIVLTAALVVTVRINADETGSAAGRPNLVVVLTDDQTLESMRVMPQTQTLIGDAGTVFSEAVANFPLCCPARATLLTGQYSHNHGVLDNIAPAGGFPALDNAETLPVWLSEAGYQTAQVGKFLNAYGTTPATQTVPPGWDHWFAPTDPLPRALGYYDYEVVDDGEIVRYGTEPSDYLTDVLAERAVTDTETMAASGRPFYLQVSMLAPHVGRNRLGGVAEIPADRHRGAFDDEPPLTTPATEESDLSDKPEWLQAIATPKTDAGDAALADRYQAYLETLLSVDELVGRLIDQLTASGVIDNTIVVFTSDNGLTLGEHGTDGEKILPYAETVDVPLYIRGPGFDAAQVRNQPVGHIDIVPTLLEAAGVQAPIAIDGEALQPFAADGGFRADRAILVEDGPASERTEHFEGVRTARWAYTEHGIRGNAGIDLYNHDADPYELESLHDDAATEAVRTAYARALDQLARCAGRGCRVSVDPDL